MTPSQRAFVAGLLPGGGPWPCAADLDLDAEIGRLAATDDRGATAWAAIADLALPEPRDADALHAALTGLERDRPEVFGPALLLVYSAYYAHPAVLRVIEERCGYAARPPQPQGHPIVLAGPDPLPPTTGGAPQWREDGTAVAREVRARQAQDPARIWTEEEIATWPTS